MHQRREIIRAVKDKLIAEKAFAWVRNSRVPLNPGMGSAYPGVTLYIESEPAQISTIHPHPRPLTRGPIVVIRVWLKGTVDPEYIEEQMDIQAARVENAINSDIPGLNVNDLSLVQTDFDVDEEDPMLHAVTLSYRLEYWSFESDQEIYP